MTQLRTAEFVSPKHPDKICDYIADALLDSYLKLDPTARVAVEVMGGHGLITLNGEVTSFANIDCTSIVQNIVGMDYKVITNIAQQSPEIARGVDVGGAGDQGIMIGFATSATKSFVPVEYDLARNLCQQIFKVYPYDGKVQVTVNIDDADASSAPHIVCVVASFQNSKSSELEALVRSLIQSEKYLINPAGEWQQGGFNADSGLSGRKLVVDAYGPHVAIGGGSFSGKDATKVDRSGAYYARKVAVDLLDKHHAQEVLVKIAYAIGVAEPVMATAYINGTAHDISKDYDFSPRVICKLLELEKPQFAELSQWGHFGRNNIWDRPF
jgi:S-adenosylmethionine synthetase